MSVDKQFKIRAWKDAAERKSHVEMYNKKPNPIVGVMIQLTDVFTTVVKMPLRQRVFERVVIRVMQNK